jgi:DNA-binding response OmpR family regulator
MSEVELLQKDFITKVTYLKVVPFDYKSYEESKNGVDRMISRLRKKLTKSWKPSTSRDINIKIEKLKLIKKYLQKALEQ